MKSNKTFLTAFSIAAVTTLAACGGGGGGGSSTPASATPTTPANTVTTGNTTAPQYAAGSAQLVVFNALNQQRQQCGFPALTENTVLDQAAQNHAQYMGVNGIVGDTEDASKPGFTGVQYSDRAAHVGFPAGAWSSGESEGFYTNATLTATQYGQQIVYGWLSGVYHIAAAVWPITEIGVGWNQTTFNGYPQIQASISIANLQPQTSSGPLTYPCQGTTGIAYSGGGETPTPPNTTGSFGTPIAVAGNPTDTIVLTSATLTPTAGGSAINLQMLDSANDPNKVLPAFEAVAYPTAPLSPNAGYSVSINGTVNGAPFSRNFTFTTGNIVG